ncbi:MULTISPECIES: hypothetical protein [Bradyrhizobium]|uniref:hypothetical protein n=1 Tax=Bradyrhizobium TaxID=374 RepID=UPI001EDC8D3D|nr:MULTISPECIES: hypothetical protein [Bradyrhizobium]MCG2640088.1 hypothetical protein [Bradyrhizobium zhengyangense]
MTRQDFVTYMPWGMSLMTMYGYWVIGNRSWWSWYVPLLTQALWFIWIAISGNLGFLPAAVFLTAIATRNLFKWRRELLQPA